MMCQHKGLNLLVILFKACTCAIFKFSSGDCFSFVPPPSGFTILQYSHCKHYSSDLCSKEEKETANGSVCVFCPAEPLLLWSYTSLFYLVASWCFEEHNPSPQRCLAQNKIKDSRKRSVQRQFLCNERTQSFISLRMDFNGLTWCKSAASAILSGVSFQRAPDENGWWISWFV